MARRTLSQIIATVQRRTNGQVATGEIFEAINDANKRIHRMEPWPWLGAEYNISVAPTYSTGTITPVDGSTTVTGVDTVWDITWKYRGLTFGSNTPYDVSSFGSPTSLTLSQAPRTGSVWSGVAYTLFQNAFPMPADYEPGSEVLLVNPKIRYRLLKLPRYTFESRAVALGVYFTNFQDAWTDYGYDETNKVYLIKLSPPSSGTTEYRLIYRRKHPDMSLFDDMSWLPESFDEALTYFAEYIVKKDNQIPGWMEAKQEAHQIVINLRRQIATSMQDIFSVYRNWPISSTPSPSMYGAGLIIAPPTGGL